MSETAALIELRHLRVHNANAVSGPLSWGFPSPTAFVGFTHALQRGLDGVRLGGIGIVCHGFEPRITRPPGSYTHRFRLMRHPYIAGWKKFQNKAAALVEEGRADLEVTLLIELLDELDEDTHEELTACIGARLPTMRIAGGTVQDATPDIDIHVWPETLDDAHEQFRRKRYRWLPGFALVERRDQLEAHLASMRQQTPDSTSLEALLDILALHVSPHTDEKTGKTEWQVEDREGWLVPLPLGYGALSGLYEPGTVRNARDSTIPFRFVETLYSVGQWLSPHRLTSLNQLLWHAETDAEQGLYLCRNYYKEKIHGN